MARLATKARTTPAEYRSGIRMNRSNYGLAEVRAPWSANLDELGPLHDVAVEFPAGASNFAAEMAAELLARDDAPR